MSSDLTTSTDNHIFSFHPIALESIKYGRGALSKESTTYSVDLHYSTNTTFTTKKSLNPLPYGEVWFTRRPFEAASTSASADAEDLTTSGDCSNANFAPKYNSQELDKESDLYYFNARHYDPELARFVTADVMVDGEDTAFGWNRYMYVHGNPIMYKDPTGHLTYDTRANEYTITERDTLGSIAKDTGFSVKQLVEANDSITNPDKIQANATINIPQTDRIRIFQSAAQNIGSTDYAYDVAKDNFGVGTNKCNKCVSDIVESATGKEFPSTQTKKSIRNVYEYTCYSR